MLEVSGLRTSVPPVDCLKPPKGNDQYRIGAEPPKDVEVVAPAAASEGIERGTRIGPTRHPRRTPLSMQSGGFRCRRAIPPRETRRVRPQPPGDLVEVVEP